MILLRKAFSLSRMVIVFFFLSFSTNFNSGDVNIRINRLPFCTNAAPAKLQSQTRNDER